MTSPSTYKYKSASVSCGPLNRHGVMTISYSGPMNEEVFCTLRKQVLAVSHEAKALVIHMQGALLLMADAPEIKAGVYLGKCPDAAIIVSPVQVELLAKYGNVLAAQGVMRVVFLHSQLDLAQRWANRRAQLAASKSQSLPHFAQ